MMMLPDWMSAETEPDMAEAMKKAGRSNFLAKSIRDIRRVICEDMQTESLAKRDGLLQKLSPRVKLVSMFILIIAVGLTRQITLLIAFWVGSAVLMHWSRLPVLLLQRRIWGFVPLITLLFTLPMTLNVFVDGDPLAVIYQSAQAVHHLGITWPSEIFISRQGVMAVTLVFLRVGISLSLGTMLVMTSRTAEIFKSLRALGVPDLLVMILEMTYRYLMVLLSVSLEMFEARKIRTVGRLSSKDQRAQVGSSIAALFDHSMALAEDVYQAMVDRCYTGSIPERPGGECQPLESWAEKT